MAKWRKKPVVIDAFKWTGCQYQVEDPKWIIDAIQSKTVWFENNGNELTMVIRTLEGNHRANRGDYIIRGVKGELYPCKPDIFKMTYDEVSEREVEKQNDDSSCFKITVSIDHEEVQKIMENAKNEILKSVKVIKPNVLVSNEVNISKIASTLVNEMTRERVSRGGSY